MIKEFFKKESIRVAGNSENPNTYLYKLKENMLIIHRAFIDIGMSEKNILLISDIHLSNWNLRDFEEKNPIILETIDKRRSTFKREDTMKLYRLITENADVVKGVFCGHWHNEAYTEIIGSYIKNGEKLEKNNSSIRHRCSILR